MGGQDIEVPVTADTSDAEAAIEDVVGSDVEVGVEADTSDAEAALDSIEAPTIEAEVTADTSQAEEQVGGLSDQVSGLLGAVGGDGGGGAAGALEAFSGAALGAGSTSSIAATGGVAALVAGLGYAVSEGAEAQVVLSQTESLLDRTGAGAYLTAQRMSDLAGEVQGYAGVSDEAVLAGENMLLGFRNVSSQSAVLNDVFQRTVELGADVATRTGDVTTAIALLGRAVDDPVAGMNRLRAARIQLTEAEKANITSLQESGDLLGARQALLDAVDSRVGGLARTYGDTFTGSVDRAKEKVGEMAEALGTSMLPALEAVSESVIDQIDRINSWDQALNGALLSGPIQAIMGDQFTQGADRGSALASALVAAASGADDLGGGLDEAAQQLADFNAQVDDYLGALFSVPDAQREARQSFGELAQAMADGTWDDQAVAMEEVVSRTAQVITAQQAQGASQAQLDATVFASISALAQMRDQGQITGAQFDTLAAQIEGIPTQHSTLVQALGVDNAVTQLQRVKTVIDGIPRNIYVDVSIPNLGAIAADVAGAAASLRSLRGDRQSSAIGDLGRSLASSSAPVTIVHQTVMPNGDVLAESVFDIDRRAAIAEGFEQP